MKVESNRMEIEEKSYRDERNIVHVVGVSVQYGYYVAPGAPGHRIVDRFVHMLVLKGRW